MSATKIGSTTIRSAKSPFAMSLAFFAALTGCQTNPGAQPVVDRGGRSNVSISWQASDAVSGVMTVSLADGAKYAGPYVHVARDMPLQRLDSMWEGWGTPWRFWVYWERPYAIAFAHYYHGRVVANLKPEAEGGARLRCNFALARAADALTGGARGECQFADGRAIRAAIPAK